VCGCIVNGDAAAGRKDPCGNCAGITANLRGLQYRQSVDRLRWSLKFHAGCTDKRFNATQDATLQKSAVKRVQSVIGPVGASRNVMAATWVTG